VYQNIKEWNNIGVSTVANLKFLLISLDVFIGMLCKKKKIVDTGLMFWRFK
jgi:hypothetical protein